MQRSGYMANGRANNSNRGGKAAPSLATAKAAASSWPGEMKRDVTRPWDLGPSCGSSGEHRPAYGHQVHERPCPMACVLSCFSCIQFCVTLRSFRFIFLPQGAITGLIISLSFQNYKNNTHSL